MLVPLLSTLLLGASPIQAQALQTVVAQAGPTMPRAALPAPDDFDGLHRYVESLAFDSNEQRALVGFDVLVAGGNAYADSLRKLYFQDDGDVRCRWVAGQVLGRLNSPIALDAMRKGLEDPMPVARIAAIEGLLLQHPRDVRTLLETALTDRAAVVRSAAVDALGKLGDKRSIAALAKAYDSPHNIYKGKSLFVRYHIVDALGQIGGSNGVETILNALENDDPELQASAKKALNKMSNLSHAPAGAGSEADRWRRYFGLPAKAP